MKNNTEKDNPSETEETPPVITPLHSNKFPILESKTIDISFPLTSHDQKIISWILTQLDELGDDAVGLAAPQLGFSRSIFAAKLKNQIKVFINPKIIFTSKQTRRRTEGCLSLPNMVVQISRSKELEIEFSDPDGKTHTQIFKGPDAQVISHEMDHLNGILITRHFQKNIIKRTSFGMKVDAQKIKTIKRRRQQNKVARKSRRRNWVKK